MQFSHHFGSLETMNRARFWLTWHGFTVQEPRRDSQPTTPNATLIVNATFPKVAAAMVLIDSIEHADLQARSGSLDRATSKRWIVDEAATTGQVGSSQPSGTPIHWHSRDEVPANATASKVAEYMFSRWE